MPELPPGLEAIDPRDNLERYSSYLNLCMTYLIDCSDVALKNFVNKFAHQSHEERECAEKLRKLQHQESDWIFIYDVKKSDGEAWEGGLNATPPNCVTSWRA